MMATRPGRDRADGVALLEPPGRARAGTPDGDASRTTRRGTPRRVAVAAGLVALGADAWAILRKDDHGIAGYLPWHEEAAATLTLHGNVDVRKVNLSFKVGGRIAGLAVNEGGAVAAGVAILDRRYFEDEPRLARARRDAQAAVLARLEHGSRSEEIAHARAQVAEREASAANSEAELRRSRQLLLRSAGSRQEFDAAQASASVANAQLASAREAIRLAEIGPRAEDVTAARAQLDAAEVELVQAGRRLEGACLVAPGGVILTRAREAGAIVQPGETVFMLTLASAVWVRTYVSEPELGHAAPGSEVEVVNDDDPSRPYRGRIGFVSPTAEFTPKTVETDDLGTRLVYRARVVVEDPDGGLMQGMPVTLRLPPRAAEGPR